MLETKIVELIAAVEKLTETIINKPSAVTGEKPKRTRRTKAEIEAEKAGANLDISTSREIDIEPPAPPAAPVVNHTDILDPARTTATPAVVPTIEQVRAEAGAVVDLDSSQEQKGLAKAQEIIKGMGFATIADVPADRRQELINKFRQAVKDGI